MSIKLYPKLISTLVNQIQIPTQTDSLNYEVSSRLFRLLNLVMFKLLILILQYVLSNCVIDNSKATSFKTYYCFIKQII